MDFVITTAARIGFIIFFIIFYMTMKRVRFVKQHENIPIEVQKYNWIRRMKNWSVVIFY